MRLLKRIKRVFSKRSPSELIVHLVVFLVFALVALSYLYILFWCVMSSLKTHVEVILDPFGWPKSGSHFSNYKELMEKLNVNDNNFFTMIFNSVFFSVIGALISMSVTSLLAYVTTKYKFPGAKFYPAAVFVIITLPIYGTGGATYKLYYNLGFVNSYAYIFTAFGGMSIYYLYFQAFYRNLSWSYAEAAEIDGANDFQVYFRVMMPQSMSLFWSLFILVWLAQWNDVSQGLLYLRDLPQLSVGVYLFEKAMITEARKDILYAGCFLCCVPPLLLFIFCNKILTSNVSLGGIKE